MPGYRPGVPGTPGHPGGFQKIYVIFSYVPFLLPRFLRFAIAMPIPEIAAISESQGKAMLHCDLRVRWNVASDSRFRAATSEPKAPSFCGISGDMAPSTRKSLAFAIVRIWCAKISSKTLFGERLRGNTIRGNRTESL